MRKRKLRGGIAVLSLATALCLAQGVAVYAEGTDDGSTLVTADLSKGIEYRYYEGSTTRVEGINLNGNSVIIRQSPNSTSSEPRLNVYNDKDRDGVLDEGEEAFEIDGSTDILPYQVYGVYGEKTKTPISITVDGASLGNVWGVYKGAMEYENTDSDPAVSITVNKGSNVSAATCLYSSEAVGSMKINISGDCNVSQLQGALQSKVDGDIGPKTIKLYSDAVKTAKTVVWNGPMGVFENPVLAAGTKAVAAALADTDATTIIGGGDSAAAVNQLGYGSKMSHISTGGGASLEFLEGKELPGVAAANDK